MSKGLFALKSLIETMPFVFIETYTDKYLEIVKKDLELLYLLRKHLYVSDDSLSIILDDLRDYDDFYRIKELL